MKNSLGNPARGEAFYQRERIIRKIYQVLKTGTSIYLSAPRRVGKTSILKYLEEFPDLNYYFIYIITESVYTDNEFFKSVFEGLLKSDAIKALSKASTTVREFITNILGRVKSISDIELREGEEPNYYELLIELLSNVSNDHGRVVIMIDEFPQAIQNIMDSEGRELAQSFIQKNRALRHHKNVQDKVNFIYTGSISLFPMVEKVTALTSINDLRTVEVGPLTPDDAHIFIKALLTDNGIQIEDEVVDYIISKLGWLIPFHIQLITQEVVDVQESDDRELTTLTVDKAFEQVIHIRNKPQFEPYFSRLSNFLKKRSISLHWKF